MKILKRKNIHQIFGEKNTKIFRKYTPNSGIFIDTLRKYTPFSGTFIVNFRKDTSFLGTFRNFLNMHPYFYLENIPLKFGAPVSKCWITAWLVKYEINFFSLFPFIRLRFVIYLKIKYYAHE